MDTKQQFSKCMFRVRGIAAFSTPRNPVITVRYVRDIDGAGHIFLPQDSPLPELGSRGTIWTWHPYRGESAGYAYLKIGNTVYEDVRKESHNVA